MKEDLGKNQFISMRIADFGTIPIPIHETIKLSITNLFDLLSL